MDFRAKNTLSLAMYLAAGLAYLRFDRDRRTSAYALASGLFALAALSKTVAVTLPAALILVFWWRRGRLSLRRDVLPLIPWWVFSVMVGLLTVWVEVTFIGARGTAFELTILERCLLSGRVIWFYAEKLFWPAGLMSTTRAGT